MTSQTVSRRSAIVLLLLQCGQVLFPSLNASGSGLNEPFHIPFLVSEPYRPIVVVEGYGYSSPPVILAAWPDGLLVWEESLPGGFPGTNTPHDQDPATYTYRAARIGTENLAALVDFCNSELLFEDAGTAPLIPAGYAAIEGPTIMIQSGNKYLWMHHFMDLYQTEPVFVTESGRIPLDGRTREQLLAEQPTAYQRNYRAWEQLRDRVLGLIPSEGGTAVVVGPLEWEGGPFHPDPYAQSILPVSTPTPTPTPTPTGS